MSNLLMEMFWTSVNICFVVIELLLSKCYNWIELATHFAALPVILKRNFSQPYRRMYLIIVKIGNFSSCAMSISSWRWIFHMTCKISDASNAVLGSRITGLDTWPASTQTIFGYSSSPKSWISLAFSTQGFQTTILDKLQHFKSNYLLKRSHNWQI